MIEILSFKFFRFKMFGNLHSNFNFSIYPCLSMVCQILLKTMFGKCLSEFKNLYLPTRSGFLKK